MAGGLAPWLRHRSYSTTSAEPPLSNFNSHWDIPTCGPHAALTVVGQPSRRGDRMSRKLHRKAGAAVYAARKAIVEPVFGQIKRGWMN